MAKLINKLIDKRFSHLKPDKIILLINDSHIEKIESMKSVVLSKQ